MKYKKSVSATHYRFALQQWRYSLFDKLGGVILWYKFFFTNRSIIFHFNIEIRILLAKIKKLDANDVQNLKNLRLMRDKLKIHLQFVADLCRSKNVKMVEKTDKLEKKKGYGLKKPKTFV